MSMLTDVYNRLVATGCIDGTWNGAIAHMPDSPDTFILITPQPSKEPEQLWNIEYPEFRIIVRGAAFGAEALLDKMKDIRNALHAKETEIEDGSSPSADWIYCYAQESSPLWEGQDKMNRPVMHYTFRVMKTPDV